MYTQLIHKDDIHQLIAGDETAFTLVYNVYSEKVYRLAYKFLKDREQSEEIVQETFITLWTSREKLDPEGNMWLYLYVISKRLSINSLKVIHKSNDRLKQLIRETLLEHNDTEEDIIAGDLEIFTEKLIEKLPRQQQLVFKMSRDNGLSYKEIASELHISPNTVKNHMIQALKTLKANFKSSDLIFFIAIAFIH